MYERAGNCSIGSIGYEAHSNFCTHCQIVGHSLAACRSIYGKDSSDDMDGNKKPRQPPHANGKGGGNKPDTRWTPRKDGPNVATDVPDVGMVKSTTGDPNDGKNPIPVGILIGNRRFKVKPMPYYVSTSGAMQQVGLEFPLSSMAPQHIENDDEDKGGELADDDVNVVTASLESNEKDTRTMDDDAAAMHVQENSNLGSDQGQRTVQGKKSNSLVRVSPNTSISPQNSFSSLDQDIAEDHHHTDEDDTTTANYPGDPMQEDTTLHRDKPKKKIGRPRKTDVVPPHTIYNT